LVGVTIVAVVVVLALILTGVLPILTSTPGGPAPGPESYSTAAGPANALAGSVAGGPWTLSVAEGWDLTTPYTTSLGSGCTVTGGSDSYSMPAFTGNYSNGELSTWGFVYLNAATTSELAIAVQNGVATEVGVATAGGNCRFSPLTLGALGGGVMDSSRVAALVDATPAVTTYLHNHTVSNASFGVAVVAGGTGPVWVVDYTMCNPINFTAAEPPTGARVVAELNATTGASISVVSQPSTSSCNGSGPGGSKTPIGSALAIGGPVGGICSSVQVSAGVCATAGDQTFTFTIEQSSITLSDVLFEVLTPSGAVRANSLAGAFALEGITGVDVAYYGVTTGAGLEMTTTWSSYGSGQSASTPITSLMTFVVDLGISSTNWTSGQNDYVVALGTGTYDGTTPPQTLP